MERNREMDPLSGYCPRVRSKGFGQCEVDGRPKKQVCINPEVTIRQGRIHIPEWRNREDGRVSQIIGNLFALLFS